MNSNIRCIEISGIELTPQKIVMLNSNIRCIEIWRNAEKALSGKIVE